MSIMKCIRLYIVFIVSLILAVSIYFYAYNRSYYEAGKNGQFDLSIGDELDIKLYTNGSTGYQNIWINEEEADCIQLTGQSYWQHFWTLFLIGSGGRTTYTFKALKEGADTILMASCPPAQFNKDGSWKKDSSIVSEHLFIVKVKE